MSIWPVWENNNILWSLGKGWKNFYELDLEVKNAVSIKGTGQIITKLRLDSTDKLQDPTVWWAGDIMLWKNVCDLPQAQSIRVGSGDTLIRPVTLLNIPLSSEPQSLLLMLC